MSTIDLSSGGAIGLSSEEPVGVSSEGPVGVSSEVPVGLSSEGSVGISSEGSVGMRSEVAIRVAVRDGISYLASGYFTPPFKVANITEDKRGLFLHLMLMCSSPGVLDGDEQVIRVAVKASGRLQLHTQSYQRLFRMKTGAVQSMEVRLEKKACFCWLPHPCVPHAHSIYKGRSQVFLSEGSQLLWGEVLTCGRKLNGEVFAFSSYHTRTEIFIADRLVLLENVYLRPSVLPVGTMGQLGGFTHQASLLFVQEGGKDIARQRAVVEAYLSGRDGIVSGEEVVGAGREGIVYGVSEGPVNSLVVRMLGNKAEPLFDHLRAMAELLINVSAPKQ